MVEHPIAAQGVTSQQGTKSLALERAWAQSERMRARQPGETLFGEARLERSWAEARMEVSTVKAQTWVGW